MTLELKCDRSHSGKEQIKKNPIISGIVTGHNSGMRGQTNPQVLKTKNLKITKKKVLKIKIVAGHNFEKRSSKQVYNKSTKSLRSQIGSSKTMKLWPATFFIRV